MPRIVFFSIIRNQSSNDQSSIFFLLFFFFFNKTLTKSAPRHFLFLLLFFNLKIKIIFVSSFFNKFGNTRIGFFFVRACGTLGGVTNVRFIRGLLTQRVPHFFAN